MSSPRRLWSGDWERDSALRAEELAARRRARGEQPEQPEQLFEEAAPSRARQLGALRRRLKARYVLPVALAALLIAGVVFALTALLGGSSSPNSPVTSAAVTQAERWLGVQLVPLAQGGVAIETVDSNGAAALGGLEPGDVISQIGGKSIYGLADVARMVDTLNPGDQAVITVNRGSAIYTTSFPMPSRPGGP
jgi:PDZ domain